MTRDSDRLPQGTPWARPLLLWTATALLFCALLWLATDFALQRSREAWLRQGRETVAALVSSYRTQVEDQLERYDQLTWFIAFLHSHGAQLGLLQQVITNLPSHHNFNPLYVNADGIVEGSRLAAATGVSVKDKEFFRWHQSSTSTDLHINPAEEGIGYLAGRRVIRLSRRLNDAHGNFDGVVSITLLPDELLAFGGDNQLAMGDSVGLRFLDGSWLTAKTVGSGRRYGDGLDIGDEEVFRSSVDGHRAHTGWSKLQFYPLQAFIGIEETNALAPHRETERAYRLMRDAGCVLIAAICMALCWLHWHRIRRELRELKVRNTFRIAVDGAREELFMVSRQPGHHVDEVEFRIEDCNGQAARVAGIEAERLIGRSLEQVLQTGGQTVLHDFLMQAMEEDFSERELQLLRGWPEQLRWYHCRAVRSDIGLALTLRDISESKEKEQQLKDMALTDALTRLPNRHWMQRRLPELIAGAKESGERFAVLFIDIDNFKTINDTLGHQAGDDFLREVATRLASSIRSGDHVVRLGGDEFMVVLRKLDNPRIALEIGAHLLQKLRDADPLAGKGGAYARASVGMAFYPEDGADTEALVQAADIAMYESKRAGKDRVTRYTSDLHRQIADHAELERALQSAVGEDQLSLYLQPRANSITGKLSGFEALLRWQHPTLGPIPPQRFIPVAEESRLIDEIGKWVAERACLILAGWRRRGLPLYPISINVSGKQLLTPDFREHLRRCMSRERIPPSCIAIELTESTMVSDSEAVQRELQQLEGMGLKLMIDDFGTGYSSLALLHRLNVDVLKIDQSFVQNIAPGSESFLLCQAMAQLAQSLGIATIAEGVETEQQLRLLRLIGCGEIQGYLASPPVPAAQAERWLQGTAFFAPQAQPELVNPA